MPAHTLERTKVQLEKMIELYNQGMNKSQIASALGLSPTYIGSSMKKAGYDFKGRVKVAAEILPSSHKLMQNFGIFLAYCRSVVLRIDQKTMAQKLEISTYKLHQLEAGLVKLSFVEWLNYVDILKVNPADVIELMRKDDVEKILFNAVKQPVN